MTTRAPRHFLDLDGIDAARLLTEEGIAPVPSHLWFKESYLCFCARDFSLRPLPVYRRLARLMQECSISASADATARVLIAMMLAGQT